MRLIRNLIECLLIKDVLMDFGFFNIEELFAATACASFQDLG